MLRAKPCTHCGKLISPSAMQCPHCHSLSIKVLWLGFPMGVGFLALIYVLISGSN